MFRTASKGIGALVTSLALMSIAGLPAHAASTKLVYGNVTEMTLSQAPMVAAKRLGYFNAEGLEVELMGFKGTGTLIPQMLAGRVDIGYPNPDTLIISREPGKEHLPLKFFYNMTRSSGWEFVVPADSPLKTLQDLDGKTIGVGAMTFGNVPITRAAFKALGVNATMVPVGIGSAAFLALTSKRIDALNLFRFSTRHTGGRRRPDSPSAATCALRRFVQQRVCGTGGYDPGQARGLDRLWSGDRKGNRFLRSEQGCVRENVLE